MENLKNYLELLKEQKITTSTRAGSPTIKTTQRNKIKHDIETATLKDFEDIFGGLTIVKKTDKGVIVALEHKDLLNVNNASGEICFEINIKVKNLDYDIINENLAYEDDLRFKEERKKEKLENKKKKMRRDEIYREQERQAKEKKRATE